MKDNIYDLIKAAIENSSSKKVTATDDLAYEKSGTDDSILMNKIPIVLNPEDYKDARSTANPNGNLIPLYRFSELVDPIPQHSEYYLPSYLSTDQTYGNIVNNATTDDPNDFATNVIAGARKAYSINKFPNMDGNSGQWSPVYAIPDDWYDAKPNNFKEISVDLNSLSDGDTLEWKIIKSDDTQETQPVDSGSTISGAKMSIQMVSLNRPWFNPVIFEMGGWYLNGQDAGFCSSGDNDGKGVIPIIPSGLIIGTPALVTAEWSAKDQQIIDDAKSNNHDLSIGPLIINSGGLPNSIYVVGWTLSVVPFSPQLAKLETGSAFVKNSSEFIAKSTVTFQQKGKPVFLTSGEIVPGLSKLLKMPGDATEIELDVEARVSHDPEKWVNIKSLKFDKPQDVCYEVTGTMAEPKITQISC